MTQNTTGWGQVLNYLHLNSIQIAENPAPRPYIGDLVLSQEIHNSISTNFNNGLQAVTVGGSGNDVDIPELGNDATDQEKDACSRCCHEYYTQGLNYGLKTISGGSSERSGVKIKNPDVFKGDRSKFEQFVNQLALNFGATPAKFKTESQKIAFAISFLGDKALEWALPHVNSDDGSTDFGTYKDFINSLKAAFDDPDAIATATRKLYELKQGNHSISHYHAEFSTLAGKLKNWEKPALLAQFKRGLNDDIKDALVNRTDLPDDFDKYVAELIKIDNNITQRKEEKRSQRSGKPMVHHNRNANWSPKSSNNGNRSGVTGGFQQQNYTRTPGQQSTQTQSTNYPVEMDLDAAHKKKGRLSEKALKYRKANNLCFNCNKKGHFASNCPEPKPSYWRNIHNSYKKNPSRLNAVSSSDSEKKPASTAKGKNSFNGKANGSTLYSVVAEAADTKLKNE
jgi:hypothetical protein